MTVKIKMLVAYANNHVIGLDNTLPWHLPSDLKRFKSLTQNNIVVMGRNTYESLPKKPLPNRLNIVVSKTMKKSYDLNNLLVVRSIPECLHWLDSGHMGRDIYVIGGQEIYNQFLPHCDEILVTEIHKEVNGNKFFPTLSDRIWKASDITKGEDNGIQYQYATYLRY